MAHLESFRANTVDAPAANVAISRARTSAAIYPDSRTRLIATLDARDGAQVGTIDEDLTRYGPGAALDRFGTEIR